MRSLLPSLFRSLPCLGVAALTLALAAPARDAGAVAIPFTMQLGLGQTLSGTSGSGTGIAEVGFKGTEIDTLSVPAGVVSVTTPFTPIVDPAAFPITGYGVNFTSGAGSFTNLSAATPGTGTLSVQGSLTLQLFAPPPSGFNCVIPLNVVGAGGTGAITGCGGGAITGNPWTETSSTNTLAQFSSSYSLSLGGGPASNPTARLTITLDLDPNSIGFGPGAPVNANLLGGASTVNGLDVTIVEVVGGGLLSANFSVVSETELSSIFVPPTFSIANGDGTVALWQLESTGSFLGDATIVFQYDPALLAPGVDESQLTIFHLVAGEWIQLQGEVDTVANKITVNTSSFSPFVLGVVAIPEPTTALLLALGLAGLGALHRAR